MARPYMPFYVGDYLADTSHLSTVQHGAYCLLLFHYWKRGTLPDDDAQLANIVHMPLAEWRDHRAVIQSFFYDGWKHKRVEIELRRDLEIKAKRAVAGQKGGIVASINRFKKR